MTSPSFSPSPLRRPDLPRPAGGDGSPVLDVRIRFDAALPLVRLAGELDLGSAHLLRDALETVRARASAADMLVLDLAGVTFCDVAGLRVIEACALNLEATGRQLLLYRPSRSVLKLIAISGVAAGLERR